MRYVLVNMSISKWCGTALIIEDRKPREQKMQWLLGRQLLFATE